MTGSRVAALVVILLLIAAGTGGGVWHLYATGQIPALAGGPSAAPGSQATIPSPSAQLATHEAAPSPASPPTAARASANPDLAVPSAADQAGTPSFDIVRVEPRGDTVVAGKGAPNAKVALLSGGKVVGETTSDASGQFVILPQPLPPGDYALTLRQTAAGKPAAESSQSVAVSVPRPGHGKVVVALAEPGKATKLLSGPPEAGSPQPAAAPGGARVAIRSAELENGTGFFVSGVAHPGTPVHVYLNNAHIADVVAGQDGAWSVRVKEGLTGGHYVVRADASAAGGPDAKVASRAEVPFDVPVAMAAAPKRPAVAVASAKPSPSAPAADMASEATTAGAVGTAPDSAKSDESAKATAEPGEGAVATKAPGAEEASKGAEVATSDGANATIESIATARVTRGDNLWNISRFRLGDGKRYTQIYAANAEQIRDPNLIYPDQVFVVPKR